MTPRSLTPRRRDRAHKCRRCDGTGSRPTGDPVTGPGGEVGVEVVPCECGGGVAPVTVPTAEVAPAKPWHNHEQYIALHEKVPGIGQWDGTVSPLIANDPGCPFGAMTCVMGWSGMRGPSNYHDCPRFGGFEFKGRDAPVVGTILCRGSRWYAATKEAEPVTAGVQAKVSP